MKRGMDPVKVQLWHRRFTRFSNSGQTVDRFCRDEGVSVPSFYLWRKRIAVGRADHNAWVKSAKPAQKHPTNKHLSNNRQTSPFQPVELKAHSHDSAADRGVMVRLPGGIEIAVGHDLLVIEQVLGQLLDHHLSGSVLANGAAAC